MHTDTDFFRLNGINFYNPISYSTHPTRLKSVISQATIKKLEENRIYSSSKKQRYKVNKDYLYYASSVNIEKYASFYHGFTLHTMGAFSYSRSNLPIDTIVGRYSSIATDCKRWGASHPLDRFTTSHLTYQNNNIAINMFKKDYSLEFSPIESNRKSNLPIVIGNDVWIGEGVTFSSAGITVGNGAVIGAKSVITKDVPPYAIVAGIPAKIIKYRFSDEIINRLERLEWWKYNMIPFFHTMPLDVPIEQFLDFMEQKVYQSEMPLLKVEFATSETLFT